MDIVANVAELLDSEGFEVMFRVIMLRTMVAHRNIDSKVLADEVGWSDDHVTRILNGTIAGRTKNYHRLLDILDDGITAITERRGELCPCSDYELWQLRRELKEGLMK